MHTEPIASTGGETRELVGQRNDDTGGYEDEQVEQLLAQALGLTSRLAGISFWRHRRLRRSRGRAWPCGLPAGWDASRGSTTGTRSRRAAWEAPSRRRLRTDLRPPESPRRPRPPRRRAAPSGWCRGWPRRPRRPAPPLPPRW